MSPVEYAYYLTGTVVALGGIGFGIRAVYKFVHKLTQAVGADKNGKTIIERLERIEHQLWPNGGSSLADKVNHLTVESAETIADIRFIKKILLSNFHVDFPEEETAPTEPVKVVKRTRKSKAQKVL